MSNRAFKRIAGVVVATMTLSIATLCVNAASPTTENIGAPEAVDPVVTEVPGVLGANRQNEATASVTLSDDTPAVLGANRDRSPRTADADNGLLMLLAGAAFAGAGVTAYIGKNRA